MTTPGPKCSDTELIQSIRHVITWLPKNNTFSQFDWFPNQMASGDIP